MKILVLLLFLQSIALGIDVKVIYVKGDVKKVDLDGKVKNLVKGDVLIEGYTVKTSADSYALLKIDGHSNHRVEENSEVMIEELPYNFENSKELEQGGSVIIQVGTIFSEITSRADIPTFQVKTKNTVMGVRGTEFMASVLENSEDVFLTVKKGEVEVQNAFSDFHDVVNVNETIVIEKDTKSTQQRRHEWTEKLQWDLSATNFEKGKRFAQVRKEALEAHKQKRKPWVRNELRFNKVRKNWEGREKKWMKRTESLKSNPKRLERRKEVLKRLGKMKTYFRETILRDEDPQLNDFIKRGDGKMTERQLEENLRKRKRLRRQLFRRRLPRPGSNILPSTDSTTPGASNDPVNDRPPKPRQRR